METYKTNNIWEASFILAKNYELTGKERIDGKFNLIFKKTKDMDKDIMGYYNNAKVEAKKLCESYKNLKDFMFSSRNGDYNGS